jgi:hypothetical protein
MVISLIKEIEMFKCGVATSGNALCAYLHENPSTEYKVIARGHTNVIVSQTNFLVSSKTTLFTSFLRLFFQ